MRAFMLISLLVALLLSIYPLPMSWRAYRPEFVALIVIYWCMTTPQYFGVISACIVGLLLDIIQGTYLGYNALGLLVIAYICHLSYRRIRSYAEWQQAGWVFIFIGIYQLFANWVSGFFGRDVDVPVYFFSLLISALLWPLMCRIFLFIRLRLQLS